MIENGNEDKTPYYKQATTATMSNLTHNFKQNQLKNQANKLGVYKKLRHLNSKYYTFK